MAVPASRGPRWRRGTLTLLVALCVAEIFVPRAPAASSSIHPKPPADPRPRITVTLSFGERVEVAWPFNWNLAPAPGPTRSAEIELVLQFRPVYDQPAEVRLNFWHEAAPRLLDPARLKERHEIEAADFARRSVEGRVVARPLDLVRGTGFISTFTNAAYEDRPAPAGEFATLTVATVCLPPGVLVTAQIFTETPKRAEYYIAQAILTSLRVLEPEAPPNPGPGKGKLPPRSHP